MEQSNIEAKFKEKLFEKYSKCQKWLIPKDIYYDIIDKLKRVAGNTSTKSRHQYYIMKKYEVLTCGDLDKLIKKRRTPEDRLVYYVSIEDTYI